MTSSVDMLTYMKLRGDLSFGVAAFNDVDAMILTQLSSIDYQDTMPGARTVENLGFSKWKDRPLVSTVAKKYKEKKEKENCTQLQPKEELLFLVGESRRFSKLRMDGFIRDTDMEKEKQFSAVTFFFSPFCAHVAFRGTDGSFVAWKENFNMSYQLPVPAQEDAVKYAEKLLKEPFLKCTIGGHSKGGNLALYSSVFCEPKAQKKIRQVFCFDAPGFMQDISEKPEYITIKERIRAYVPESTVFGAIMKIPFDAFVVKSDETGIRQHGMITWQVKADGLVLCKERDEFSRGMERAINEWIKEIPAEDKPGAVNEVFEILRKSGILSMDDLTHMDWKRMVGLLRSATKMTAKNREHFLAIVKRIWEESRKTK